MSQVSSDTALAALTDWWEEMGVDVDHARIKALGKGPSPRKDTASPAPNAPPQPAQTLDAPVMPVKRAGRKSIADWVQTAESLARQADTLDALKTAIEGFEGCPLKAGANKTVIFDGTQGASVMVIGEGEGGTEDRVGLPFVGKAGQLLDKMLAAIDLDRKTNTFITNVTYWRPPGNRNPEADELAVCRPFVDRMIELNKPKLIIAAGGVSAKSLLRTKTGIMKLRGHWVDYTTPGGFTAPVMPTFHPAYLLRRSQDKSRACRDLLEIQARLEG